jgi:hypothetical protein
MTMILKMHGIDNFKIHQIQVTNESIHSNNDIFVSNLTIEVNHNHHHIPAIDLGHLLTRSVLTYPKSRPRG